MANSIQILSTRPLSPALADMAGEAGIVIDEISFILTEPIQSVEVQQEIEQAFLQSTAVVFTSMNAVDAVATYLEDARPDWKIYCIGNSTFQLAGEYFGKEKIAGTANSAKELAELIAENYENDELIFFCGDQRREELPDILKENGIEVNEIIVYHTLAVPQSIEKKYHGILFFSPSAVNSFFAKNKLNKDTVLFAIGNTTGNEIKKYTTNKIMIADEPGKENLLRMAIDYFT